jgi:hypothetical protein
LPWQKGGIENAIGRLRRQLPRKTDLDAMSAHALATCLERYNDTPEMPRLQNSQRGILRTLCCTSNVNSSLRCAQDDSFMEMTAAYRGSAIGLAAVAPGYMGSLNSVQYSFTKPTI